MNGVHDLGGMDGFGRVEREPDEPVFHEPWEGRIFAIGILGAGLPSTPVDAFRHRIELLGPVRYLGSRYYERWLSAMEDALIESHTLSREELEGRIEQLAANAERPMPRHEDAPRTEGIARALRTGNPASRKIRRPPRFQPSDKIVTRNLNPHGHTRLPRYARGKHGTIVLHHGAHVFPDTNAHGMGENPQHLYTVRISARELWGDSAEPSANVLIDLWESYLEKDKTAAIASGQKTGIVKGGSQRSSKSVKSSKPTKVARVVKPSSKTRRSLRLTAKPAMSDGKAARSGKRAALSRRKER